MPEYFKQYKKNHGNILENIIFIYLNISEILHFDIVRKDGQRNTMKIRPRNAWKSWIWDQHLPENMEWYFGGISKTFLNFLSGACPAQICSYSFPTIIGQPSFLKLEPQILEFHTAEN